VQSSSQIVTINKPTSSLLQAGCPSCRPTNSVKALKTLNSLSLHFNGHFPGEPGLAGVYLSKG